MLEVRLRFNNDVLLVALHAAGGFAHRADRDALGEGETHAGSDHLIARTRQGIIRQIVHAAERRAVHTERTADDALIAAELITHKSVTLYCTGGQLQRGNNSYVYVGPDAMQSIAKYRTSKCFIGCSALNFEYGLMVFSGIEAEIKKEIAKSAESIICLADSSKFNRTAFSSYLRVEEIDVCITDDNVAPEHVELLKQKGVQVIVAGEND